MKTAARIIAVIMAVMSLFTYTLSEANGVLAEELREQRELDEAIAGMLEAWEGTEPEELEYSALTGEAKERRGEYTKHFRRGDGLVEAVTYPYPVHFERDGEWVDIDNGLELITLADGSQVYKNRANDFEVSFGTNLNSDKLVEVSYGGHELSWKLAGAGSAIGELGAEAGTPEEQTDEERDMALRFPAELSGRITYNDTDSGAQISYEVTGKSVAELITIDEAPSGELSYRLEITSGTVTPVKEGGTVYLKDANNETIFVINEPTMWDANGNEGGNVEVSVEEIEGEGEASKSGGTGSAFAYTIRPDAEWLSGSECTYPVTIDPDIQPVFRGTVEDTYISSNERDTNFNGRDRVKIGGTPHYRSLIKITGLPELEAGDVVIESTINLCRYNTSEAYGKEIDVYRVIKAWNANTVTWNSFNPDSAQSVALERVESLAATQRQNYFNTFDITRLVKYWYANPSQNHGMILKSWNEAQNWYTEYRSSDYNASYPAHPFFSVIYVNTTGLEGNWTYHSQDVGRAGTGSVNAYTGNLVYTRTDATISNREMPIEITHVYNTNDKDTDHGYGFGWRINYAQTVEAVSLQNRSETATYYRHTDGDGTRHYYVKETATKYVNELDKDSVLTIDTSNSTITISDKGDNKLVFACEQFDHPVYNVRAGRF